tara:strand:+ start:150 stop:428 length:279 start_codon:yes stop_codon:yes gene_type:complete
MALGGFLFAWFVTNLIMAPVLAVMVLIPGLNFVTGLPALGLFALVNFIFFIVGVFKMKDSFNSMMKKREKFGNYGSSVNTYYQEIEKDEDQV